MISSLISVFDQNAVVYFKKPFFWNRLLCWKNSDFVQYSIAVCPIFYSQYCERFCDQSVVIQFDAKFLNWNYLFNCRRFTLCHTLWSKRSYFDHRKRTLVKIKAVWRHTIVILEYENYCWYTAIPTHQFMVKYQIQHSKRLYYIPYARIRIIYD